MVKVPNGRYAIKMDGTTKFYKINTPDRGKWKGYTFVEVQASDDLHAVRDRTKRAAILAEIGRDVRGALAAYGIEIGCCGRCGRTLTSEWRKVGIGPECVKKV